MLLSLFSHAVVVASCCCGRLMESHFRVSSSSCCCCCCHVLSLPHAIAGMELAIKGSRGVYSFQKMFSGREDLLEEALTHVSALEGRQATVENSRLALLGGVHADSLSLMSCLPVRSVTRTCCVPERVEATSPCLGLNWGEGGAVLVLATVTAVVVLIFRPDFSSWVLVRAFVVKEFMLVVVVGMHVCVPLSV